MYRQLYQMGGMGQMGIESLSPMQPAMQPAMQSAMYSPLQNNYSGMPMMANGGRMGYQEGDIAMSQPEGIMKASSDFTSIDKAKDILQSKAPKGEFLAYINPQEADLLKRHGGSGIMTVAGIPSFGFLKDIARTFIPKELDPVLKIAAPFLGPVYGPIASIAGSARTGKIDPFSLAAATLPYLQFNPNATGLQSLIPTGYGGSGLLGQYLPGGSLQIGSGTSLTQLISDKAREFLSPNTPTQNLIKGSPDVSGAEKFYTDAGKYGFSDPEFSDLGTNREIGQLYSEDFLKNAPEFKPISTTGPTYGELIKKAGSLENVSLSERFNAVKDLSTKALTDLYTKPIINPKTGETTNVLDKNALFATFAGASSYYEALQLAKKAGIPESEFSEADYQRLKIDPEKAKYKDTLKDEAFGIRKAEGGRIGYSLGDLVRSSGVAVAIPGGNVSESRGLGGMIQRLIQQNPQMFRTQMSASRRDFIDNDNNGIDDREEAAGGGLMGEGVLSIKLTPAQAMAMGGRIGYQMGGLGSMDPLLALQRSPFDQYGFSDPVISALTGNVFTSGQRFRDVTDLSSGPDIQRAQSLGYSQPEIQELGLQRDMLASYRRALSEASLGPTFQANPEKTALDLATSLRQMYMNPTPPSVQQQPIQQQVVTQQQTQQPQMSYNEMQKADYARRMGALEDKFARQGTSATQYIQDMTNLLAQMKTSGGVDPLGAMQSKYYTESGGGSVSEGSPRGIDARFIINRAQKAEQDAAARVTPKKANGGRINYFMGSEIPVRQNQGGITELDLRAKGGYIPVGIKEKADDVPAMLSRNEFVFTADAVRGAGGGNINKGAQKMYKLMKSLEKKVKKMKKVA